MNKNNLEIIKSIYYDQSILIDNIMKLYNIKRIELDPTFSKGNFYKNKERPKYCSDINPQFDFVAKHDCRSLPFDDKSISSIIFDPPFLATKGKSLLDNKDNNKINKRFSVFPTEIKLHKFYVDSMKEFYRILDVNGKLIFKCQDKVSSGKQYLTHCFIIYEAFKIGLYPLDLMILIAKNRLIANWQRNQKHCRKFHCYFLIFNKIKPKIDYINLVK